MIFFASGAIGESFYENLAPPPGGRRGLMRSGNTQIHVILIT